VLPRIDLLKVKREELLSLFDVFLESVARRSDAFALFGAVSAELQRSKLLRLFAPWTYFADIEIGRLSKSSEDIPDLLHILANRKDIPPHLRALRQAAYRFACMRGEADFCLGIIRNVGVSLSSTDFQDFTGYCSGFIPLITNDPERAKTFLNYLMNIAVAMKPFRRRWVFSFVTSFASLVYGNSIHTSILEFVRFESKPTSLVKSFSSATQSLYDLSLGFFDAPILLRPYFLWGKWHLDKSVLAESKNSADVHNALLVLSKTDPTEVVHFLKHLPVRSSISFYYPVRPREIRQRKRFP
jgi:hypothetical protein